MLDSIEYKNFQKFIRCIYTGHELIWADYRWVKLSVLHSFSITSDVTCEVMQNWRIHQQFAINRTRPHLSAVWNRRFFCPVWPIVQTYSVKTVTENVSFPKHSTEWRLLITLASRLRVHRRKRMFSNTMMSWIIYYQHNACSVRDAIVFPLTSVFV